MVEQAPSTGAIPVVAGTTVRPLMLLMYGFFAAAGVVCFFAPSRAVASQVTPWMTLVWAGFFFVGGVTCLVGSATSSWWGELLGLPLIAASSLVYGTALLIQYGDPTRRDGAYLFVGTLLIAQGLSLAERWIARWRLLRVAQGMTRRGS